MRYGIFDVQTGKKYESNRNGYRHNEYATRYNAERALSSLPSRWRAKYVVRQIPDSPSSPPSGASLRA